jgi:hypothetical protein
MWDTCLRSASSVYHAEFHEGCYQKHTNPLNCRTSSSDISGYHADFHDGHSTVGEWQGHDMAFVWINTARHGMWTTWAWHGMCVLAFSVPQIPHDLAQDWTPATATNRLRRGRPSRILPWPVCTQPRALNKSADWWRRRHWFTVVISCFTTVVHD